MGSKRGTVLIAESTSHRVIGKRAVPAQNILSGVGADETSAGGMIVAVLNASSGCRSRQPRSDDSDGQRQRLVILASPDTRGHSPDSGLLATMTEVRS